MDIRLNQTSHTVSTGSAALLKKECRDGDPQDQDPKNCTLKGFLVRAFRRKQSGSFPWS